MSRRKTKKPATKRQTNNMFTTTNRMEKDFLKTPKKLAAQLNKEISYNANLLLQIVST